MFWLNCIATTNIFSNQQFLKQNSKTGGVKDPQKKRKKWKTSDSYRFGSLDIMLDMAENSKI